MLIFAFKQQMQYHRLSMLKKRFYIGLTTLCLKTHLHSNLIQPE